MSKYSGDEIGALFGALFLVIIAFFVLNFLYTWLWSIIAVSIFELPALTYWQVFGLRILLCGLIPYNTNTTKVKE